MAPKKVMKAGLKPQVKAKSKAASTKASAVPKAAAVPSNASTKGSDALSANSLRAHEVLMSKQFSTPDQIIKYMDQMNPKDKEQIWKQYLICKKKINNIFFGWWAVIWVTQKYDWLVSHI